MSRDPFCFARDGAPACVLVHSGDLFPLEIYEEVSPPDSVNDTPVRHYMAIRKIADKLGACGARPRLLTARDAVNIRGPRVILGRTSLTDPALLGEATSYQYALVRRGGDLYALGRTAGGCLEAIERLSDSIVFSEDGKSAWLPEEALGVYDRTLPPVAHAFKHFTLSYYGSPYNRAEPEDETTFRGIVDFGVDMAALNTGSLDDPAWVARVRALIARLYEKGISTRLYGVDLSLMDAFVERREGAEQIEENVRKIVERYGDMDAVTVWGFYDEPEATQFEYCALVRRCFRKYDAKKRPVYINMGQRAHTRGIQSYYDRYCEVVRPDFHCLDRYPFFPTPRGPAMDDPYFYAHCEINRNEGIDCAVDTGLILAAIKVGGAGSPYCDVDQFFMDWQTNVFTAYGNRYLEQYVYYHVHDYCILGEGNAPTHRWHIARRANLRLRKVGRMLEDKRLDAVFHLPNRDGAYDIDVTPYGGYGGAGEVSGVDALLSFFSDGTVIVTNKRCNAFDSEDHDVTLGGLTGEAEWFDPEPGAWKDIASCPAARRTPAGLTLTLARSTQYILRPR